MLVSYLGARGRRVIVHVEGAASAIDAHAVGCGSGTGTLVLAVDAERHVNTLATAAVAVSALVAGRDGYDPAEQIATIVGNAVAIVATGG